jgi:hypothetical protein
MGLVALAKDALLQHLPAQLFLITHYPRIERALRESLYIIQPSKGSAFFAVWFNKKEGSLAS